MKCSRLFVFLLFLLSFVSVHGQIQTTEGTDFWFSFIENSTIDSSSYSIYVVSRSPSHGTITCSNSTWSHTFDITPDQFTVVQIPKEQLSFVENQIDSCSFHVVTDAPISLFAVNYIDGSCGVTNIIPTPAVANDYMLQSYHSNSYNGIEVFRIISLQNNTLVHINRPNQAIQTIVLQQGETYYSTDRSELSGTKIWTDCDKKLAVFQGCKCACIPSGSSACDIIFEEAIPTRYWGKSFALTSSYSRSKDRFIVTALLNHTHLYLNDDIIDLQSGESYEFELTDSLPALFLFSNYPICVIQYETGASYGGLNGDPSSSVIHPLEEGTTSLNFVTFSTIRVRHCYVNIVTNSQNINHIYLDSVLLPQSVFRSIPNSNNYVYARVPISFGAHNIYSDYGLFGAHVYGLGDSESYAFSAGSSIDPINPLVYVNGQISNSLDSNITFCQFEDIVFSSSCFDPVTISVYWDFDDGTSYIGQSAHHSYSVAGHYDVTVSFIKPDNCYLADTSIITFPLNISKIDTTSFDTVVCSSTCVWNDSAYFQEGSYFNSFSVEGRRCDSIAQMNILRIGALPSPSIHDTFNCQLNTYTIQAFGLGDSYHWNSEPFNPELEGHRYDSILVLAASQDYLYQLVSYYYPDSSCIDTVSVSTVAGSPLKAHIKLSSSVVTPDNLDITITDDGYGASLREWLLNGVSYGSEPGFLYRYPFPTDSVAVFLHVFNEHNCSDCDSVLIKLNNNSLFVPNIITPSNPTNAVFRVEGSDIMDGEIWIFDRSGRLIWHTSDISNTWDATYHGKPVSGGTYVYTISYRHSFEHSTLLRKTGTLTIVR